MMLQSIKKGALLFLILSCMNVLFLSVRDYGIAYGSYQLRYSYYGMLNTEKSFRYANLSFSELSSVSDRLWIRHNFTDFSFSAPNFADNMSMNLFLKHSENVGFLKAQPMHDYFTEVLFLRNGTFDVDKHCGYKKAKNWITQSKNGKIMNWFPFIQNNWFPFLVPLRNRDGSTFQHFLDGTLHRIVQILPLLQNRTVRLLMRRPRDAIVYDILRKLRISSDQLVFQLGDFRYGADLLIHSCMPDTLHPTLWRETRRLLGVPQNLHVPFNRALIVVVTRGGCFTCGRRLLNLDATVKMLQSRYGNDVIKVIKGALTLESSLEIFGKSRIILGPHGGGLYNMNFAPYGTTVIEFMPTKENGDTDIPGHQIFWKVSNILYHNYWRVCLTPDEQKNMLVDINGLSKLLDKVDTLWDNT